jgi:hypothetical protein
VTPIGIAAPLPECLLCETPTRRDVHDRNGGLCSQCNNDTTVRIEPLRNVNDDRTAYVERWLPPVPGQTRIGDDTA